MITDMNPLKDKITNVELLNAIRTDASLQYQQRIPQATKANVQDTMRNLTNLDPQWNEFLDALINRIGAVYMHNKSWTNPLAEFKRGMLQTGDTIEEIQYGLLKAHTYDPDRDAMEHTLFGQEIPDVQANFHRINRQNFYKITVNDILLKRAFVNGEGVNDVLDRLLDTPRISDELDEFELTTSLFKEYEANGGFYKMKVPDVNVLTSNDQDAKRVLRQMRALAGTLQYPSTAYNAAKMPTFMRPEELVIFCTPDFQAAIDVNALAGAFNLDKTVAMGRVITLPPEYINIDGCQAIITSKDFFVIADTFMGMRSQPNAATLGTNYFWHHHGIISASRFVPAVMMTTEAQDEITMIDYTVTGVDKPTIMALADGTTPTDVQRGGIIALQSSAQVSSNIPGIPAPEMIAWSVSGGTSNRTYITSTGVLHVGFDETANSLTVTARATYRDADDPRAAQPTATTTVAVSGPIGGGWPATGVFDGFQLQGVATNEPFAAGTTTYSVTLPKGTTWKGSDVTALGNVNTEVTKSGDTATIVVDTGSGTPTTYTLNVTYV